MEYGPSGYIPPAQKCVMGKNKPLSSQYARYGCNLYDYYNKCKTCSAQGKCLTFSADTQDVICGKCTGTQSCIAMPDDGGFGCPGKDFTSDPVEPLDPAVYDNLICKYSDK